MSSQYDRIDDEANPVQTNNEQVNSNSKLKNLFAKLGNASKKTSQTLRADVIILESDRSDIISASSSTSFYDSESLMTLWHKSRIVLISLGIIIVIIIILIALFAFEPWKS